MRGSDPARLSRDEIVTEVGEILAVGVQRLVANRIKSPAQPRNCEEQLDDVADREAPCQANTELPA